VGRRNTTPLAEGDTGRMGFLEPEDSPDGVRHHILRRPFWRNVGEQLTYQNAVESNPRKRGEGALSYIQRIAEIAAGKLPPPAKDMPRLPYRDDTEMAEDLYRQKQAILAEPKA
jgi:hypothetical protein